MVAKKYRIPEALGFLYGPARYKVVWGGRGKGASWGIADALLIRGIKQPLRWLCTRETQESMDESVHALLSARIVALGLEAEYEVERARIMSRRWKSGAQGGDPLAGRYGFSFAGLRNNNTGIKSYEGYDGAWVEEAQGVTRASWEMLIPTIRKPGSEIWVSFNPELDTDETYRRFVLQPPSDAVVVKMSWRDNPWFPAVLKREMEELRRTDPDTCDYVYEGIPRSNVAGAVFGDELKRCDLEQRITQVPYDPRQPVHTFWDVGLDTTAIWFVQAVAMQVRLIDYYENKGKGMDHYVGVLQSRGYVYGTDWLPWDVGVQASLSGMGAGQTLEAILRGYGRTVRASPRWHNTQVALNAARLFFPRCWFDGRRCEQGIRALRRYQWGPPPKSGATTRQPLHDWASHGAAAFQYVAGNLREQEPEEKPRPPRAYAGYGNQQNYAPFG